MGQVPGIDVPAVTHWLQDRTAITPPIDFEVIQGGRSNLTYTVTDAEQRRFVLRRPPLHGVLQSAHDVGREHRLMASLAGTGVPVPPLVGHEPDPDVNGAPFFVMEFVDGLVVRDVPQAQMLAPEVRRIAGEAMVRVLAALHAVDPDEVGLGDLGRREGYLERQLRRWHRQLLEGSTRDLPLLREVHDRLAADVPEQVGSGIVHGDYRLDNLIVSMEGEVQAVLDWELCTLGDPLADLGLLQVYWLEPGDEPLPVVGNPTTVPGFPTRAELVELYTAASGRDVSELSFYVAFGAWKLAVILEGVVTRFADGAYGDVDDAVSGMWGIVDRLAEESLVLTKEAGR